MMASKAPGQTPVWRRRWVWAIAATLAVFAAGFALGAGSQSDDGSRCAASPRVVAVGRG